MPRSAAIVLLLGLLLPAAGQTDRPPQNGFGQFSPRNRPAASPGGMNRRQGAPAGRGGYIPGQPGGNNGYFPTDRGVPAGRGTAGGQGTAPGVFVPPANPQNPRYPGMPPAGGAAGASSRFPAGKPMLDARGARAKKGRVPSGFGQLGLSQDQRERIYGVQALYDSHIKRLEKLIERLEAEEDWQCQSILNPLQKQMYLKYLSEK